MTDTENVNRRWGILTLSVLMFLAVFFVSFIGGGKGSLISVFWICVGYLAYKGQDEALLLFLKVIAIIEAGLILVIAGFVDSKSSNFDLYGAYGKTSLLVGLCVMLVLKISIFSYLNNQIKSAGLGNPGEGLRAGEAIPHEFSRSFNMPISKPNVAQEDAWYEQALDELNSGATVKATWARAMVEGAGDDAKTKAAYIRLRLVQLQSSYQGIPIAAPSSGEPAINDDATVSDDAGGDSGKKIQTSLEEVIPSEAKGEIPRNLVASSTATVIWSAGDTAAAAFVMLIVIVCVGFIA